MTTPESLLVDAELRAAENPDTFEIPDAELRGMLVEGLLAKVILESDGHGERVWVRVTRAKGDGSYTGKCLNNPVFTKTVQHGSLIHFSSCHVIDVQVPTDWKG